MNQERTVKVAAIQLEATAGDVVTNVQRAESLCLEAIRQGAKVIALPEFFTSRIALYDDVFKAVLPPQNIAVDMMKQIAQQHQCWIGGSMLVADAGEVYNRYHLVEPNGIVHLHDKDLPTMVENAFYTRGKTEGAFETQLGGVGAAMCWEVIRNQTARRLFNKVDMVMTGTHWWTLAQNWSTLNNTVFSGLDERNRSLSEGAPAELAQRLGVPVIQASHCGQYHTRHLLFAGTSASLHYETEFVGATQIVDAQGRVLASRNTREGPGIVTAEITLGRVKPIKPIAETMWIPQLPALFLFNWFQQNWAGRSYYEREGRQKGLAAAAAFNGRPDAPPRS